MGLKWAENLSVGNAVIDAEHKNLIGMTENVGRAIGARDTLALLEAFRLLESWLCIHFINEEKIARAVAFPFGQRKQVQQYLLKELQYMRDELAIKNGLWSDSAVKHFSRSLKSWMIDEHILKMDMPMKPVLQTYGYNFLPG